jgi:hypothetical protein
MEELNLMQLDFEGTIISCPLEEGHRMVPVKTICEIIDVQFKNQDTWLKEHQYYSQLYRLAYTVGGDSKQREMNCLPVFDILSWLSSISENNRKDGSTAKQYAFMAWLRNEMMAMYKLIEVFQEENNYELSLINQKSALVEKQQEAARELSEIKKQLKQVDDSIEQVRSLRYTGQTALPFPE